jgi:hypothetical protein
MRTIGVVVVTGIAGLALQAQPPAFEVASVKMSDPGTQGNQTQWDPGRLVVRGTSVKQLLQWAYQVTPLQISGGPSWLDTKKFDIEAKLRGRIPKTSFSKCSGRCSLTDSKSRSTARRRSSPCMC